MELPSGLSVLSAFSSSQGNRESVREEKVVRRRRRKPRVRQSEKIFVDNFSTHRELSGDCFVSSLLVSAVF